MVVFYSLPYIVGATFVLLGGLLLLSPFVPGGKNWTSNIVSIFLILLGIGVIWGWHSIVGV